MRQQFFNGSCWLCFLGCMASVTLAVEAPKPNIVFLFADDPCQMTNQADNPSFALAIADCEKRLTRLVREIDFDSNDYPQ